MFRMLHFIMLAGLALSACGPSYEGSADVTVEAWVPAGQPIHETHRAIFVVDGREVAFTHVEYGLYQDCASGCFAAHLCAIEEGDVAHLYHASWYEPTETPLGVLEECPDLEGTSTSTRECETSGRAHPVTATAEFREFAADQKRSGPLRWCF